MSCYEGSYYPDAVGVPLAAVVHVPDVPARVPVPQPVPAGLEVGQWVEVWAGMTVTGLHAVVDVYVDWSALGQALSDFTRSTTPLARLDGAGVYHLSIGAPHGRFLLLRFEGVLGNAIDTKITATVGGI